MAQVSKVKSNILGRDLKTVVISNEQAHESVDSLPEIGIHDMDVIVSAMDTALVGPASASGAAPAQNLQHWLPGVVHQLTKIRNIDELLGTVEAGEWLDETIVQQRMEFTGKAELYGDYSNIPLASYKHGYETRQIVRLEQGFEVSKLASAREAKTGISMADSKRNAAITSIEIARNRIGFYGYNGGAGRTYGLLNDPGLPAYVSASKAYSAMTFEELTSEIGTRIGAIITQSGGNVSQNDNITIALPVGYQTIFTKPNSYGQTVTQWMRENYPNVRLVYSPEFAAANGGANVAYYFADRVEDGSTDGGNAAVQIVPAKFYAIGAEKSAKGYLEDFGCATAGVLVKRPYLFVRVTGV